VALSDEERKKKDREHHARPEYIARAKERRKSPEYKAVAKKRRAKPENRAKERERDLRPENRAKRRKRGQTPKYIAKAKERREKPENKAREKERNQSPEYRAREKEYHGRPETKAKIRELRLRPENIAKRKKRERSPEHKAKKAAATAKTRFKVLQHYSKRLSNSNIPCCRCCGENSHVDFLAIDHIAGRNQMNYEPELVKLGYSSKLLGSTLYTIGLETMIFQTVFRYYAIIVIMQKE